MCGSNSEKSGILAKLFEPVRIGNVELKNRLVMPPMGTDFADKDDSVTQRTIEYYRERARGGVGLVIVEGAYVHRLGKGSAHQISLTDDGKISGLRKLAGAIRGEGTHAAIQLFHGGRQSSSMILRTQPVSASDIPCALLGEKPRPLTLEEIEETIEAFGEATRRIRDAGFEIVEIHAAHGYLINQFLSPLTNLRKDRYGGNFAGRTRFLVEIVQRIRKKVGGKFPVICRMNGSDYFEGGLTLPDAKEIAQVVEKAGVNAIHVSGGIYDSKNMESTSPMWLPRGFMVPLAHEIKQVVKIPVIAVGRINDIKLAEEIVEKGQADLVSMGRALITDPELPRKAMERRLKEIRSCIACNEGCINNLLLSKPVTCILNAAVGREEEFRFKPTKKSKKVMVIGGGVGGMEFARIAATRGHHVSLYEKNDELGGQVLLASVPSYKYELKTIIPYFRHELERLAIDIHLEEEATESSISKVPPDIVCVATGSVLSVPDIQGIKGGNVVLATDVLAGKAKVGERVAILGGGEIGLETGYHLSEQGKKVAVIEQMKKVGTEMIPAFNSYVRHKFTEFGGKLITLAKVIEINKQGAVYEKDGDRVLEEADTVVIAMGQASNTRLLENLRGKVPELYAVGNAVKPGKIMDAVHGAAEIARKI
jgi:2,4-dienoyl-CoA reductase-like NADH-dependent reductase (Old Yellow Enzyme family)/thioredoxin reductase